jgi:uncharacterized repeat protein (TIGR01451 family)
MNIANTAAGAAFLAALVLSPLAHATGTAAGTDITNTASATFTDPGGTPRTATSNTTSMRVDELLDVTIVSNDAGNVAVTTPASNRVLSFTVTNTGNGSATYVLGSSNTLSGDQFNPANTRIYLDNGDNTFDVLTDTLYVAGSNDPVIAADGTVKLFVVSDIPAGLSNTDVGLVSLNAESAIVRATPATDVPGTVFAGAGTAGVDAVVGSTQALANRQNGYVVSQVASTLSKTQSVLDGFGGTNPIPGAVITYTLTFTATGSGSLTGAQIADPVPAGTTYKPGSLALDSATLTDLADADAGSFASGQIAVLLGTVTAPATHTVTFQVTIN